MAANKLFGQANEEFVNENYQKALELYTEAIKSDSEVDDYYCNRAQVHLKLENYNEAVSDSNKACELNPKNSKAYFRKGVALFHLQKYKEAKETFLGYQLIEGENSNSKTWIRKCEAELDLSTQNSSELSEPQVGVSTNQNSDNSKPDVNSQSESVSPPSTQPTPVQSQPKIKHDWYQTQTHVVVTVLLKSVKKENLQSEIQERSLNVNVKLPQGSEYVLDLNLAHSVVPEKSQTKILSSKIEIKMKKSEERQWTKLEDDGENDLKVKQFKPEAENEEKVKQYPTSSHYTRNWDKLVDDIKQEEKDEKLEGDAALNQLFQKIYADGNDETKKAMMKSFYESGGTVLSTNWKEVGTDKVEVKPPDGMEHKKWEY